MKAVSILDDVSWEKISPENEKDLEKFLSPYNRWRRCLESNQGHYGYELSSNQSCFLNQSKKDNIISYILGRCETRLCDFLRLLLSVLTQEQPLGK